MNLFPMSKIAASMTGWYMDSNYDLYSDKTGLFKKLDGTISSGGRKFSVGNGYGRQTFNHSDLIRKAKGHADFSREVAKELISHVAKTNTNFVEHPMVAAVKNRSHAVSTDAGVKSKGSIIGRIHKGHLVFGSEPVIHTSKASVEAEMLKLAGQYPGVTFVELNIGRSVVSGGISWA